MMNAELLLHMESHRFSGSVSRGEKENSYKSSLYNGANQLIIMLNDVQILNNLQRAEVANYNILT